MKDHILNGHHLRCYHKPSRDISTHPDAWTVLNMNRPDGPLNDKHFSAVFWSARRGLEKGSNSPGVHLGRRIPFEMLPEPCRRAVLADCPRNGFHEVGWCCPGTPAASRLGLPAGCWAVYFIPEREGRTIAVSGHTTKRGADSACTRLNA